LDGDERVASDLAKVLEANGFIVNIFVTSKEKAEYLAQNTSAKVYLVDAETLENRVKRLLDLNDVEVAIAMSPSDRLNLEFAKLMREAGVPKVLAVIRSSDLARIASEEYGIAIIELDNCIVSRVADALSLNFSRVIRIDGEFALGEIRVTADSRLIGKPIRAVEEEFGVALIVNRDGRVVRDGELQEGDVIYVVGKYPDVEKLINE